MEKIKYKSDIVEYKNFLSNEECQSIIDYFNTKEDLWQDTCFYNTSVIYPLAPMEFYSDNKITEGYFHSLRNRLSVVAEETAGRGLTNLTLSGHRWLPGSFAADHSDNSELDGTPNAWQDNKFVTIIYLNDNYSGGDLTFSQHNISISPSAGSVIAFDPGFNNLHGVTEITEGNRYTILSSWNYSDVVYSDDELENMRREREKAKYIQEQQREEWKKGRVA